VPEALEPADLEAGVVAFLKSRATLVPLVGERVFAGELPENQAAAMPRKAIVLKSSGGVSITGNSFVLQDAQRIDVFAFGETPHEAAKLMRVIALELKLLRRSVHAGVLLQSANTASGASGDREPQVEWPRMFQSFQIFHALTKVEQE